MFVALAVIAVAGCAGHTVREETHEAVPHGYVAGAEESAEAQSRLVLADSGTGGVRVLDLITGEVESLGTVKDVEAITGDGRFAYLSTSAATHIVDSGAWTVDHGDHVHYYRARPRLVGTVSGGGQPAAAGDTAVTALSFADGAALVLDRARLEKGEVTHTSQAGAVLAVPYAERLLVARGDAVEVRRRDGAPVARLAEPCREPRGHAVTRRGAVFGCADGALLISGNVTGKGGFTAEKIGYPAKAPRATAFSHRPGSTTLTARAGTKGTWLLDVSAKAWKLLETGPMVAVNTAGAGSPVLTLDAGGVLHAFDPGSGKRIASTKPLSGGGGGSIQVDTTRAYVNDPAGRAVHEIDYNDRLRRARTFTLDFRPTYMVETGR
ncbi:hypothetical protein [Nonomuraea sp. NPDC003754]